MNHSNFGGPYPHPDDERQWGNLLQGLFGFGNWGNQPPFGPPGQGGRPPGPPFGPPSGGPGRPPFGPPPGQGGDGPPSSPPPSFTPTQQQVSVYAVDPGGIRGCLYRYTYVWLNNRQQFWYYPTFVGRNSIAGYRWMGFYWAYFGIDLKRIDLSLIHI